MSRLALAVLSLAVLTGCRGRVSVSADQRPFDAETETLRAEAAQIAARADARLLDADSARARTLRSTRDSLRTALDTLATATGNTDERRATIRALTDRLRGRVARYDSLAAPSPSADLP